MLLLITAGSLLPARRAEAANKISTEALGGLAPEWPPVPASDPDKPAPQLWEQLRTKKEEPAILFFYTPDQPVDREEYALLNDRLHKRFAKFKVTVIPVDVTAAENQSLVEEYAVQATPALLLHDILGVRDSVEREPVLDQELMDHTIIQLIEMCKYFCLP